MYGGNNQTIATKKTAEGWNTEPSSRETPRKHGRLLPKQGCSGSTSHGRIWRPHRPLQNKLVATSSFLLRLLYVYAQLFVARTPCTLVVLRLIRSLGRFEKRSSGLQFPCARASPIAHRTFFFMLVVGVSPQVEMEGELYSVPDNVEFLTPTFKAATKCWKVGGLRLRFGALCIHRNRDSRHFFAFRTLDSSFCLGSTRNPASASWFVPRVSGTLYWTRCDSEVISHCRPAASPLLRPSVDIFAEGQGLV